MQRTSLKYCLGAMLLIGLSCSSILFAERPKTTPPRAIHSVDPKYPKDALRVAKDKVISVTVTVQPDGIPTNIKLQRESDQISTRRSLRPSRSGDLNQPHEMESLLKQLLP